MPLLDPGMESLNHCKEKQLHDITEYIYQCCQQANLFRPWTGGLWSRFKNVWDVPLRLRRAWSRRKTGVPASSTLLSPCFGDVAMVPAWATAVQVSMQHPLVICTINVASALAACKKPVLGFFLKKQFNLALTSCSFNCASCRNAVRQCHLLYMCKRNW